MALRRLKAFKRVASRGCGDVAGGGRVEGTHNCLLREAFSPAFVPLAHCTLTFLTAAAPVGSRHRTPYSLRFSAFSDGGPNNNATQPSIVSHWKPPRLHKQSTRFFFFFDFWEHFTPIFSQHFIATPPPTPSHTHLAKGFVEPRPPAGIREDGSRAFRWVFRRLLLPRSSRNIIGTVHFVPAFPLCPVVTQSICLSTSSHSLWVEACLFFVIALQFTPCSPKRSIVFCFFFFSFLFFFSSGLFVNK